MTDTEWINTGEAAAIVGYSTGHFREKFLDIIPNYRLNGGYTKWFRPAVEKLRPENQQKKAG